MPSSKIVSLAWRCAIWLLLLVPLGAFAAPAVTIPAGPDLTAAGGARSRSGKKANQFVGHPDSIEVISSSSVSRLYRPVEVDLKATPVDLAMAGRPARAADRPDAQREDDTALTIYVGFPGIPTARR